MNEEQLLEFLYTAPVALIQFDDVGAVKMANPRIAQLFNRFAPGGYFANFFTFLEENIPVLHADIIAFTADNGQVMENKRFCVKAPTQSDEEELWLDVTIMRQEKEMYIGSLNNVTNQVRMEAQRYIAEERLAKLFQSVSKHVIFTMDTSGVVDSWNITGETYITDKTTAEGKLLSQILPITVAKNAEYLQLVNANGMLKEQVSIKDREGNERTAQLCIYIINDQRGTHHGYSVVLTIGE